jgi:hypothetical protein
MEQRLLKFAQFIVLANLLLSVFVILDELLPPSHIYAKIMPVNSEDTRPLLIDDDGYSKMINLCETTNNSNTEKLINTFSMWVESSLYLKMSYSDKLIVYTTPIRKKPRFIKNFNSFDGVDFKSYIPPKEVRFFIIPLLILCISLVGLKIKTFEIKIPIVFFSVVMSFLLQWFLE